MIMDLSDLASVPSTHTCIQALVFVRNIDRKASEHEIQKFFSKFGNVCSVRKGPKSKTTAFVRFDRAEDACNVYLASPKDLIFNKKQLCIHKSSGRSILPVCDREKRVQLNSLPNEILQHIFSFLDFKSRIELESVCKRWRMIGKTIPWQWPTKVVLNSYWYKKDRRLDVSGFVTCTDKIILAILSRCSCNLKEVTLHAGDLLTFRSLYAIKKCCPNLTSLILEGFHRTSVLCLRGLAQRCTNLRVLGLQSFYQLKDDAVTAVLENCTALEHLDISYNSHITGECLEHVTQSLQVLHMNMCFKLKSVALEKLINNCDSVRVLQLAKCQLDKNVLIKVFRHFRNTLTEVRLDSIERRHTLDHVALLKNLEKLSVYGSGLNDEVLKSIAKSCTKLVELNIGSTFVTDVGIGSLANLIHLKVLHIPFTKTITGEGIAILATKGRLEKLDAKYTNVLQPDDRFGLLAKHCVNFRFLDASSCRHVSNKLVQTFCSSAASGFLKQPVKLVVQGTLVTKDVQICEQLEVSFGHSFDLE